jgi:uncharacterized protein (DUF885 family)
LQPGVTEDYGVWKLPDGDRFYDHLIHSHTTTTLDAEQVHNIGLSEVARIEKQLDAILKSQGLPDGTIGARIARLNGDARFQYANDDSGRAACIADYQRYMDEMVRGLAPDFASPPKLNIKVERVPRFKEKTAPVAYADTGSLDGSRPGVFYVNLRDMRDIRKYQMRTLAYHEAVPGHQLQGVIAQRLSLQDRDAEDPGAAGTLAGAARLDFRHPPVSQCRAGQRLGATEHTGETGGRMDCTASQRPPLTNFRHCDPSPRQTPYAAL